jgi:hypothetical protein
MINLFGMKKCNKCKENKELSEFGIHHKTKDKLQTYCKSCINSIRKQWKQSNPKGDKQIYLKKQAYYKLKSKNRYHSNKPELLSKQKEYYQDNKERISDYYKQWREINRDKINKYNQQRKNQNPTIKLSHYLRSKISSGVKNFNGTKQNSTLDILCLNTWEDFKIYLESKWLEGMNWENYGLGKHNQTWHIDHTIPISSAKSLEEVKKLNHYTNLNPMWCSDNIRKSNKF